MKKTEQVYREILFSAFEKKQGTFTQLGLSKKLEMSLSTVNYAIAPLRRMGAVEVTLKSFRMVDSMKILYYWASIRNLENEIIYKTRVDNPVKKTESEMPNDIIFGAYTAYKLKFKDTPADYSEVYVYGDESLKDRFPENKGLPNLFVMKTDENIQLYGKTTSIAQTFVDLWNLKEWYAKEYLNALQEKIKRMM